MKTFKTMGWNEYILNCEKVMNLGTQGQNDISPKIHVSEFPQ
jgi:hypothetical protein